MINFNELYMEVKRTWRSLYPIYFDRKKSLQEGRRCVIAGRRMAKDKCVDAPTLEELAKALEHCKVRSIVEPHKSYSRDYFEMGRVKVQVLMEGVAANPLIPSKRVLMDEVARQLQAFRK